MSRLMLSLLFIVILSGACKGNADVVLHYVPDTAMLEGAYEQYREPSLYHRRFKHADIEPLIERRQQDTILDVQQLGISVLGKSIYQLKYGDGPKRVMLWSQMHGNEPTATMALMDLFNFLEGQNDGWDSIRFLLREHTSLYFIPMLNPDGADVYMRRNAMDVDINRDARAGATVEGDILIRAAKTVQPHYGFNLHDQNIYYRVPETANPVTIALLAPAYNEERDINDVRGGAMKIAAGMAHLLRYYIPDGIAKYDDTYTPRGFGDNFQSWGASTVLIESGGYKGDTEKQYIRKLNFIIILNSLLEIAQGSYQQYDIADYHNLPLNQTGMTDLLLRNVTILRNGKPYRVDLSIKRDEITVDSTYYVRSCIEDIGDLLELNGYDELEASGLEFVEGKTYPTPFETIDHISSVRAIDLLRSGYSAVQVNTVSSNRLHNLPLMLFQQRTPVSSSANLGREATFFLAKEGRLYYAVVNGYLIDLNTEEWGEVYHTVLP